MQPGLYTRVGVWLRWVAARARGYGRVLEIKTAGGANCWPGGAAGDS